MRRLGVIVATAALVTSLAGCGQSSASDDSQTDTGEEGAQQAEEDFSYPDDFDWRFYPGTSDDDTREIVCWGDSMTQGVGADDDTDALVSLADGELYDNQLPVVSPGALAAHGARYIQLWRCRCNIGGDSRHAGCPSVGDARH